MITASQFDQLSVPITDLYEQYTQSVLNDIARRLAGMEMTSTAAWQMQRLTESGKVYEEAIKELSKLTGKTEQELKNLFSEAGIKAMKFDDSIYKQAGLNPLPLNLSPAMVHTLLAGVAKTNGSIRNITMSTAGSAQQAFLNAADLAYMQVSNGAMSYDQAIRAAIKSLASKGMTVIDYATGHRDQLDVAMRRTVLTGVSQTAGKLQQTRAEQLGQDLVQTSAHIGSRPSHQEWQGKIFSRSGSHKKYPDFVSSTGYGEVDGLCGINCRHSFYPFFEGISKNAYDKETLNEYADKTVTYRGQDLSVYEATQTQRQMEREIRKIKREAGALSSAGLSNVNEISRIKSVQAQLRDFVDQTGLSRQSSREGGKVATEVKAAIPVVPVKPANAVSLSKADEMWFEYENAFAMKEHSAGLSISSPLGDGSWTSEELKDLRGAANVLQKAASENNLKDFRRIFRGATYGSEEEFRSAIKTGKKFTLEGLTAASPKAEIANIYRDIQNTFTDDPVSIMFEIENPNGVIGYLRQDGAEIILPAGSEYKVTRIFKDEQGWRVTLWSTKKAK